MALGAAAKGRSASHLLNRLLLRHLPDFVAYDTELGFLFAPSRLNPGDAPSRLRPEAQAAPGAAPRWYRDFMDGDSRLFDAMALLPRQRPRVSGWATFAVRFAELGLCRLSPRQLGWDSTLGYPGEGPRPQPPRPRVDITTHRVLTEPTLRRRARLRLELETYVVTFFGSSAEAMWALEAADLDRLLADYGQ